MPKGDKVSIADLAALCLWKLTYSQWSEYDEDNAFFRALDSNKPRNRYEVALERLENSIYKHQIPQKYRPKSKEGRERRHVVILRGIPVSKQLNKLYDDRMNRCKRKRKYRQEKRKEFLQCMGNRQAIVDIFTMTGSSFKKGSCDYLLNVKSGDITRFRSPLTVHALDYIYSSMADYCILPSTSEFKEAIVFVVFKQGQVATSQEIDKFKYKVEKLFSCSLIYGQAESAVHETEVTLLMFNQ